MKQIKLKKGRKEINGVIYDFSKSKTLYCNRSEIVIADEEIVIIMGNEIIDEGVVEVENKYVLTFPSFLRIYDVCNKTLKIFKDKGMYKEREEK